eukprot:TRINITY_DN6156_c0_g1_i1.p1 TRINITY_DN6156_c0_g1~~TRINITY_DN6156_c0_g1_i1.p1  ORF type:complete len:454 (-),score=39.64 TRINITY_DN6156_c0_g1_i1:92-1453(-)
MTQALILFVWVSLVCVVPTTAKEIFPGGFVEKRFALFAEGDAPLDGSHTPQITFHYVYERRFSEGLSLAELLVVHETQLENVGVSAELSETGEFEICCNVASYSKGLCNVPDRAALSSNSTLASHALFYYSQQLNVFTNTTFTGTVPTNTTGFWHLFLMNCDYSSGQSVEVSGRSEGLNVYGYLPATAYGNIVLYWVFNFFYTVLFVVYCVRLWRWKSHVQRTQQYIALLLFVAALDYLWLGIHYSVYNSQGYSEDVLASLSVAFSAIRTTFVRIIILLIAIGHQMTVQMLSPAQYTGMAVLFGFYFFITGTDNYWRFSTLIGQSVSLVSLIFTGVCNAILNILYVIWVFLALRDQNLRVRGKKEEEEMALDSVYKRLFVVFGCAVIFCFAFWVAEVALDATGNRDNVFQWLWLVYSYWDWAYLFLIVFLAWEWRPGKHNDEFAYQNLVGEEQ